MARDKARRRSASSRRCACSTRSNSCAASRAFPRRNSAVASAYLASVWVGSSSTARRSAARRVLMAAGVQMDPSDAEVGAAVERIDEQRGHELAERFVGAILLQERAAPGACGTPDRWGLRRPPCERVDGAGKSAAPAARRAIDAKRAPRPADTLARRRLEFVPRISEAIGRLVAQAEPQCASAESGRTSSVSCSARSASASAPSGAQHARQRQARSLVAWLLPDGRRERATLWSYSESVQ